MLHLGDITKINGADVPPVNVIIGGSPCQDLSVAGKRAGLSGERSGLFMEQLRIIKEMRRKDIENGAVIPRPRYMVWENVTGAFSSNKGRDFKTVLEETIGVVTEVKPDIPISKEGWHYSGCIMGEGFSLAWRVFDAQFWGVPQRRRRIALVADFGGFTAPEILFERKSVRGYTPPSGTPWKDFAAAVAERFGGADNHNAEPGTINVAYSFDSLSSNSMKSKNPYSGCRKINISKTLDTTIPDPSKNQGGIAIVYGARGNGDGQIAPTMTGDHNGHISGYTTLCVRERCGCEGGGKGLLVQEEKSGTLAVSNDQFVAQTPKHNIINATPGSFMNFDDKGLAFTLSARDYKDPQYVCLNSFDCQSKRVFDTSGVAPTLASGTNEGMNIVPSVLEHSTVRRLTPLECERLQGFPDGWTDIGEYIDTNGKKRKTSDTARYKALWNSIALPSWAWLLERLNRYCTEHTMASLFDGIGGFPLIWETLNGKGACLWASEIDEFPIAVTKHHFS